MSSDRPAAAGVAGRAGEELDRVALGDRLGAVLRARPASAARAGARPAARASGTRTSGRRSRSRRAARSTPGPRRAGSARPRAASAGAATGVARRSARCRRGRRSARRRPSPRPRPKFSAARRSRSAKSRRSARALHRVDEVVGGGAAVERGARARAAEHVAAARLDARPRASKRAGSRASARTGRPSSERRSTRRPPTYPVAPVTSSIGRHILPDTARRRPPADARIRAAGKTRTERGTCREKAANCGQMKEAGVLRDRASRQGERVRHHARRMAKRKAKPATLRRLLLPPEHALRAEPQRALHDVPPRRARPRARAPARLRVPHRAHARAYAFPQPSDSALQPLAHRGAAGVRRR